VQALIAIPVAILAVFGINVVIKKKQSLNTRPSDPTEPDNGGYAGTGFGASSASAAETFSPQNEEQAQPQAIYALMESKEDLQQQGINLVGKINSLELISNSMKLTNSSIRFTLLVKDMQGDLTDNFSLKDLLLQANLDSFSLSYLDLGTYFADLTLTQKTTVKVIYRNKLDIVQSNTLSITL